jgi:nucleoside-diphosphate-sugar epimerase
MHLNVIITGSTGMVGKAALLECLESEHVHSVLLINRTPINMSHPKIKEIIHHDFQDFSSIKNELKGYNACFLCMGVSSMGMSEEAFYNLTYTPTVGLAILVAEQNPDVVFTYVSGQGTDSTEKGRIMWARVKGKTENALLKLPSRGAYMFRANAILPEKRIKSKTKLYNLLYILLRPFFPLMRKSKNITTTTILGKAMINAALHGYFSNYLENNNINELGNN